MSPRPRLCSPLGKVVASGVYERCEGGGIALRPLVVWRDRRHDSPFGKAIRRSTFTCLTFTCLHAVNKNLPALPWTSLHGGDAGGGGGRRCRGAAVNLGKCVCAASVTQRAAASSSLCSHVFLLSIKPLERQCCVQVTCIIPSRQVVRFSFACFLL